MIEINDQKPNISIECMSSECENFTSHSREMIRIEDFKKPEKMREANRE